MKYILFTVILILFLLGNYYVFHRAWAVIPSSTISKTILLLFAAIVIPSFFLAFFIGEHLPVPLTSVLYTIGTSWFFTCFYFLLINLLMDLVKVTRLIPKETLSEYTKDNWLSFGLIAGFIGLLMLCGYLKYRTKERVELTLTINKVGEKQKVLKVVALSDMHLGYTIGKAELDKWVELINREQADIILIGGDIIDSSIRPVNDANMAESFRHIDSKYGIYAVLGNHEYISGSEESVKFYSDAGINLLRDNSVLIDNTFYVVGRDDKMNSDRQTVAQLTESLDKSKPVFLLDHQPFHLEEAQNNGVDFQLSGHTHRGQIWPMSLITDLIYEKSYGYIKKGDANIYVSSGMGIWGGKFRIGTQSEYVVVNIEMQ